MSTDKSGHKRGQSGSLETQLPYHGPRNVPCEPNEGLFGGLPSGQQSRYGYEQQPPHKKYQSLEGSIPLTNPRFNPSALVFVPGVSVTEYGYAQAAQNLPAQQEQYLHVLRNEEQMVTYEGKDKVKAPDQGRRSTGGDPLPIIMPKQRGPQKLSVKHPNLPVPLEIEQYRGNALKKRLAYADDVLQNHHQRISPVAAKSLAIYKKACKSLIEMEEREWYKEHAPWFKEAQEEWRMTVSCIDCAMQYRKWLRMTGTDSAEKLQDQILALKRSNFYARYGDLFEETCCQLKVLVDEHKVSGRESLSKKYWTEIAQNIKSESSVWDQWGRRYRYHKQAKTIALDCPTHWMIKKTCDRVGFSMENMLEIIKHYSMYNELVHTNLITFIREGKLDDLKKLLYDDICDVHLLFPAESDTETNIMIAVINSIIELLYDRNERFPNEYQRWLPTKDLLRFCTVLEESNDLKEAQVSNELTKAIMHSASKTIRRREMRGQRVKSILDTDSVTGQRTKRVAPENYEVAERLAKGHKRAFAKYTNLVGQVKKMSDALIEDDLESIYAYQMTS
ncbi:hypothetical protein LOZ57_003381 [Ophidiomyces ophidiicola]|uniref:uncharacterized protein n=1 Tax=Ophidiomyces ophidiicola TaxID=1387563 RepID=UPI0020C44E73|nr:uncharacterized protein LOZ57_003381 [Ophidiomyces ophidiicola]KAI1947143.1 hypothetical protein LOZ57_003381 [Ophidiomyces ophidiicola]KAI2062488.1 hypothetical protein LOZ43_000542 [Ophidiomyces ophidiicola]